MKRDGRFRVVMSRSFASVLGIKCESNALGSGILLDDAKERDEIDAHCEMVSTCPLTS